MEVIDIGVAKIGVAASVGETFPAEGLDAVLVAESLNREVRLDGEIAGLTQFAVTAAARSENCAYPVLYGCCTRLGTMRHVSVMTFAYGQLADIADRTLNLGGGGYAEGDTIKILRTPKLDIGLLVDTDILLAANWKRIVSDCDAVAGIAFCGTDADFAYIPTFSSLFGKPYAVAFADGGVMWGNGKDLLI